MKIRKQFIYHTKSEPRINKDISIARPARKRLSINRCFLISGLKDARHCRAYCNHLFAISMGLVDEVGSNLRQMSLFAMHGVIE